MSKDSPAHRLADCSKGERPCVQAQVNIYQNYEKGTQLWFGDQIPTSDLPDNNRKDFTKTPNHPLKERAHVRSGAVVMWKSNVTHGTKKAGKQRKSKGLARLGQFVCASPSVYRNEEVKDAKLRSFENGKATSHLPTQCKPDGALNHMSNNPARSKSYCIPLPKPQDDDLIKLVKSLI